jgi:GTP-binding protein HflX
LAAAVSEALSRGFLDLDVQTSVGDGRLMAYLAAHGEVLSKRFDDTQVTIHCRLPQKHLGALRQSGAVIRNHNGAGERPADPDILAEGSGIKGQA